MPEAMFLDPEPKKSRNTPSPSSSSGFFSSRSPIQSPGDLQDSPPARKPLHDRTSVYNNHRNRLRNPSPEKSTVRLVKHTPSTSSRGPSEPDDPHPLRRHPPEKENWTLDAAFSSPDVAAAPAAGKSSDAKLGLASPAQQLPALDLGVSGRLATSNDTPAASPQRRYAPLGRQNPSHATDLPPAPHRRSFSSDFLSDSSTLVFYRDNDSPSAFGTNRGPRSIYQEISLRDTPARQPRSQPAPPDSDAAVRSNLAQELLELPEDSTELSTELSTVRTVPQSLQSRSSDNWLRPESSDASLPRPRSPPYPRQQQQLLRRRRRSSSTGSLPYPESLRRERIASSPPLAPNRDSIAISDSSRHHHHLPDPVSGELGDDTRSSIAYSDASVYQASSVNYIVYSSPGSRTHSPPGQGLRDATSFESISSRLQFPTIVRPGEGSSSAARPSMASVSRSPSLDTLPPLHIPKKRVRQVGPPNVFRVPSSSDDYASSSRAPSSDADPASRPTFTTHLSTIMSGIDWRARLDDQPLLHHPSIGSRATGGTSRTNPGSGRAGKGAQAGSDSPPNQPVTGNSSSEGDEAGDMTLGIFREESAKPQPLFDWNAPDSATRAQRRYDGQPAPVPPRVPPSRDSDEGFDQLAELYFPRLREMRSGQSLRRRSISTPSLSHSRQASSNGSSYQETDRLSVASSLFPPWAKDFYTGNAALMSPSKISLSSLPPSRGSDVMPLHSRNPTVNNQWTNQSIDSQPVILYDDTLDRSSPDTGSFLPAVFRPRTRARARNTTTTTATTDTDTTTGAGQIPLTPTPANRRVQKRAKRAAAAAKSKPATKHHSSSSPATSPEDRAVRHDSMGVLPSSSTPTPVLLSSSPLAPDHNQEDEDEITPAPLFHSSSSPPTSPSPILLPSGHPKYGKLKTSPSPSSNVPRKYSKQKLWDNMSFPRPMSKDQLPVEYYTHTPPVLLPTARNSRLSSAWRPPSFVDSLDTLFRSKANRQLLCFLAGFACPAMWWLGAILPLPERDVADEDLQQPQPQPQPQPQWYVGKGKEPAGEEEWVDIIGDPAGADSRGEVQPSGEAGTTILTTPAQWQLERLWMKARWWRTLNRVMSFVGLGVVAAVIAIAIVATH